MAWNSRTIHSFLFPWITWMNMLIWYLKPTEDAENKEYEQIQAIFWSLLYRECSVHAKLRLTFSTMHQEVIEDLNMLPNAAWMVKTCLWASHVDPGSYPNLCSSDFVVSRAQKSKTIHARTSLSRSHQAKTVFTPSLHWATAAYQTRYCQ